MKKFHIHMLSVLCLMSVGSMFGMRPTNNDSLKSVQDKIFGMCKSAGQFVSDHTPDAIKNSTSKELLAKDVIARQIEKRLNVVDLIAAQLPEGLKNNSVTNNSVAARIANIVTTARLNRLLVNAGVHTVTYDEQNGQYTPKFDPKAGIADLPVTAVAIALEELLIRSGITENLPDAPMLKELGYVASKIVARAGVIFIMGKIG